eukprot:5936027-Pyramimonas_sp.AAC.1
MGQNLTTILGEARSGSEGIAGRSVEQEEGSILRTRQDKNRCEPHLLVCGGRLGTGSQVR